MTSTLNFNLPIDFSRLQNDRLKLVPLEDNLEEWASAYIDDADANPQVFDWLTYGPFANAAEYIAWYNATSRNNPSELLLAIILKAGTITRKGRITGEITTTEVADGTFAGLCGIVSQPPDRATVDLGQLLVSRFHRTFVGTHANALLLHHCLDSVADSGLGLRRVQWQADASNEASVNAAKRLGFRLEGVIRWQQVVPVGKRGLEGARLPRVGWDGRELGPGRHTAMLSLCWDDWVDGGRELVDRLTKK
ncbi:putative GNAT family acetyltransferase [Apodospora peruviana]|uniref:GNAT family acetyltransferase n=1 Tax=Apodospora peruviana TaxID=516989 RepID=A0AAE0HT11_9PEZI|nr:putative GNAT family acetyltransferase [Apodospora peruviana]